MNKPLCLISGPVFNRSGYGDWATSIAKSIIRYDKFDVKIAPTRWGNCQSKRFLEDLTDPEDKILASKFLQGNLNKQPDVFVQLTIPEEFQAVGKYNIGMTAGIETTIPPGSWIEGVNKMDLTIGLSNHVKKTFSEIKMAKQLENGQQDNTNQTRQNPRHTPHRTKVSQYSYPVSRLPQHQRTFQSSQQKYARQLHHRRPFIYYPPAYSRCR
jgi:hypothetical protein